MGSPLASFKRLFRGEAATEADAPSVSELARGPDYLSAVDPASEEGSARRSVEAAQELDPGIVCVVAEKLLGDWLRNRYQLLFPFALNLRQLEGGQPELLIHAMLAAAQADGSFDGREHERIEGVLAQMNPRQGDERLLKQAAENPRPLNEILRQVQEVRTAALIYAASLMAIDQRKPTNRYYLKYLASRLQLSEELVGSLEQRYRT